MEKLWGKLAIKGEWLMSMIKKEVEDRRDTRFWDDKQMGEDHQKLVESAKLKKSGMNQFGQIQQNPIFQKEETHMVFVRWLTSGEVKKNNNADCTLKVCQSFGEETSTL